MSYNPWLGNLTLPIQYLQPYPTQQSYTTFNNLYQQQQQQPGSYTHIAPNYVPVYNTAVQNYENNYSQQLNNRRVILRNKKVKQPHRGDSNNGFKVYESHKRKEKLKGRESMKIEKVQVCETQHNNEKNTHNILNSPKDDVNLEKIIINRKNFKDKRRSSSAENDSSPGPSDNSTPFTVYETYKKPVSSFTSAESASTPSTSDEIIPTPSTPMETVAESETDQKTNAEDPDLSIVDNACMNCVFVPYQMKPSTTKLVSKSARKRLRIKMSKFNSPGSISIPSPTLVDKENKDPKGTGEPLKKADVLTVTYTTKIETSTDPVKSAIPTGTMGDSAIHTLVKVKVEPVVSNLPSTPAGISKSYCDYIRLGITGYGHYATDKGAFNCNKCKKCFPTEVLFETHIIREHAQTIRIKDFRVDINLYYQNLKANVNDSDKTCPLPTLAINENDRNSCNINLSPEYEKWFEFTALKRFYCKLCENYYSSQTMVQEHLTGRKHKARTVKELESALAPCDS